MAIEIPEDAYQFTPCGQLGSKINVGSAHEHVGEFNEMDEALAAVREKMDRDQFWPSLVWVSDHGSNWWYIDTEGNEIKVETEECEFCGEEFEQGELELHTPHCPSHRAACRLGGCSTGGGRTMDIEEAIAWVEAHDDCDSINDDELATVFATLVGRPAEPEEDTFDRWSIVVMFVAAATSA